MAHSALSTSGDGEDDDLSVFSPTSILDGNPNETVEIENPDTATLEDGLARRRIRHRQPWWERLFKMAIRRRNQTVVDRDRHTEEEDEGLLQGEGGYENVNDFNGKKTDIGQSPSVSKTLRSILPLFSVFLIFSLAVIGVIIFLIGLTSHKTSNHDPFKNWGKPNTSSEGLRWYPTNFLQDVIPIPCHSHNDYWRRVPLLSALYAGCISTESDVWLFDNELFVGHNTASLTTNRTFQSLYINPLVEILEHQNPGTRFYNESSHGVFDTNSEQSLTLLVDVKTDGATTWPFVLKQLEPLRERGWLTFVENGVLNRRPIIVVGTGETPFDILTANASYRDAFFDSPLDTMWLNSTSQFDKSGRPAPPDYSEEAGQANEGVGDGSPFKLRSSGQGSSGTSPSDEYTPLNSYYASTSFAESVGTVWWGRLTKTQLELIRGRIRGAHEKGLKVRYWDTPSWPTSLRNHIWKVLVEEGVDILNVDDLDAAKKGIW